MVYTKVLYFLPDDWTLPNGLTFTPSYGNGYETNKYDFGEWQRMEAAGAVFLPITGRREGTSVDMSEEHGRYWLTTHNTETTAEFIDFQEMSISRNYSSRKWGQAVRLVRRVQKPLVQKGWVDMGLPSGTLWYSCNIGTTKPQGYGAYFAWGESRPKAEYTWETYQYGNASNSLTKYCYNASYGLDGYTDNLSTLELSDDAARAVMGGDARTPTESECNELMDNCTSEWTTYMGVNGWMLTSNTNGNRLFLPAAGQKYGSERDYDGVFCLYLTSTLNDLDNPPYAYRMYGDSDDLYTDNSGGRIYGLPVRPVRGGVEPQQETLAEAFDENGASIKTFTVAEGRTVHFSKGNLWYNAAANLWRFAPEQYEYIGDANSNISETYNEYIDLFGWGTSGWNSGATAYQPWATSQTASDYYPGGSSTNNLTGEYANADWGVYNSIVEGGDQSGMWRTMTSDEWEYLLFTRNASTVGVYENARYAKATVNDVGGLIILPDSFTMPSGVTALDKVNEVETVFTANVYTTTDWAKLESAGAIFLPAAGARTGTSVGSVGTSGGYWSSTYDGDYDAWHMSFDYIDILYVVGTFRYYGFSVRLVKD